MLAINQQNRAAIVIRRDIGADLKEIMCAHFQFAHLAAAKTQDFGDHCQRQNVTERKGSGVSLVDAERWQSFAPVAKGLLSDAEKNSELCLGITHGLFPQFEPIDTGSFPDQTVVDNGLIEAMSPMNI